MSLPWGVKEFIDPAVSTAFKEFVTTWIEKDVTLPSGYNAQILKADVKEKKDKVLLIMRYQLTNVK